MDTDIKIRTIDVWIDDFTPCLKDRMTGEVVNTEVVCLRRKSFLSKFNKKSGWYVNWGNNPQITDSPKYAGVGGHLFAIAGSESIKAGFGGAIYGYAANPQVLKHYMEKLNATHVGILHPYQFCVFEDKMQEIIKTYTYAYSREEI